MGAGFVRLAEGNPRTEIHGYDSAFPTWVHLMTSTSQANFTPPISLLGSADQKTTMFHCQTQNPSSFEPQELQKKSYPHSLFHFQVSRVIDHWKNTNNVNLTLTSSPKQTSPKHPQTPPPQKINVQPPQPFPEPPTMTTKHPSGTSSKSHGIHRIGMTSIEPTIGTSGASDRGKIRHIWYVWTVWYAHRPDRIESWLWKSCIWYIVVEDMLFPCQPKIKSNEDLWK